MLATVHPFRPFLLCQCDDLTNGIPQVVPSFSSAINSDWESKENIDENHIGICKFGSREDASYQATFNVVTRFRNNALEKLAMPRPSDEGM